MNRNERHERHEQANRLVPPRGNESGRIRRAVTADSGATAAEFALVAPIFFLAILAFVEIGMAFFVDQVMSGAAEMAARRIRTGEAQESGDPLGAFQQQLCESLNGTFSCDKFQFDVRTADAFTELSSNYSVDANGQLGGTTFAPGGSEDVTMVRVAMRWEWVTPMVGDLMANHESGSTLLISTSIFRNEPYLLEDE